MSGKVGGPTLGRSTVSPMTGRPTSPPWSLSSRNTNGVADATLTRLALIECEQLRAAGIRREPASNRLRSTGAKLRPSASSQSPSPRPTDACSRRAFSPGISGLDAGHGRPRGCGQDDRNNHSRSACASCVPVALFAPYERQNAAEISRPRRFLVGPSRFSRPLP